MNATRNHRLLFAAALALAVPCAAATDAPDAPDAPEVATFRASVRVDVDANGTPVAVEAPERFEDGVRAIIEERVASWQYQPARVDDVPVETTTYVAVNVCAIPKSGGYWLGVDFLHNGARLADGRRAAPPEYPDRARRNGSQADVVVILDIAADGRAEIDEFEKLEVIGPGSKSDFERAIRNWIKTLRYDLETVAGAPVPARVRQAVNFAMLGSPWTKDIVREERVKTEASRECRIASGDSVGSTPVALEPAVKVTPVPAG